MGIKNWLRNLGKPFGHFSFQSTNPQRSHIRNQCLITSEFDYFGNVDTALIKNLNGSGAFIETGQPFKVGEVVQLKFPLHYLDPLVEVRAVVAWIGLDGVGVKFLPKNENEVRIEENGDLAPTR